MDTLLARMGVVVLWGIRKLNARLSSEAVKELRFMIQQGLLKPLRSCLTIYRTTQS